MATYLKSLAALLVLAGTLVGANFVKRVMDHAEEYRLAKLRAERNPGHMAFESEFRMVQAGQGIRVYSAAGSFLIALVGGSLLWGVGSLHSKLDRR